MSESEQTQIVYAVVFGKYSPSEVDALFTDAEEALKRTEQLKDYNWRIQPMVVFNTVEELMEEVQ